MLAGGAGIGGLLAGACADDGGFQHICPGLTLLDGQATRCERLVARWLIEKFAELSAAGGDRRP